MDKLVYTYVNPVSACLVKSFQQWPGARSTPGSMVEPARTVDRPKGFFRPDGPVPPHQPLKLTVPPAFRGRSAWRRDLEARIAAREAELRAKFDKKRRRFLGRCRVLKQSPDARPRSRELRRGLNPRVAGRNKWRRIECLQRLKGFLAEYRRAWLRFSEGDRSVRFPYGTYGMRVHLHVSCSGP